MPAYYGETAQSCALDRRLERTAELIGWKDKYPCKDMGNGKVRSVGIAMAMQGSGISGVDVGSATIKMNDDGFYTLMIAWRQIWEPDAIRSWHRWRQSAWTVRWKELKYSVPIQMRRHMIRILCVKYYVYNR